MGWHSDSRPRSRESSGRGSLSTGKAKVVAFNDAGKHHVLEAVGSEAMAEDRKTAIERDYKLLGLEAWCEKYNVPKRFVEE
jgi:hypothetical protein